MNQGFRQERHALLFVTVSCWLAALVACEGTVSGDRAANGGACPEGETCSEGVPAGLLFVGEVFYDSQGITRLGPVLDDGTFDLRIQTVDGAPLPHPFAIEVEDPTILSARIDWAAATEAPKPGRDLPGRDRDTTGTLTPLDVGGIQLTGLGEGTTMIRVVDSVTGELYDRLAFTVSVIDHAELVNAHHPERDYAYAGCNEALGLHLVDSSGVRLFDQSLSLTGEGIVQPDPGYWDCFLVDIPTDRPTVHFDAHTGGTQFPAEMPVRTLEQDGLSACP
jgi:hypothetical protein